jgi:hypothetical protein
MNNLTVGSKWGNYGLEFIIKSIDDGIVTYEGVGSKVEYEELVDYVLANMNYLGETK